MVVPNKITPEKIKDSIISFTIDHKLQYEEIIGHLLTFVRKNSNYEYIITNNNSDEKKILFYNDNIKYQVSENVINVNCNENYIGWKKYREEIRNIIETINSLEFDINITTIGLRYVSEFEETNLDDKLNFFFSFGEEDIKSNQYSFSSQFTLNDLNINLTLRNNMPKVVRRNITNFSHIDIDVSKNNLKISIEKRELIFSTLENIHDKEKQIFFKLLKSDYLKELNPKY